MNPFQLKTIGLCLLPVMLLTGYDSSAQAQLLLDDFESGTLTSRLGTAWRIHQDAAIGGESSVTYAHEEGILRVTGQIVPASGSIGYIELRVPLDTGGSLRDLSGFKGVQVRLRVTAGLLALKLLSPQVTNFDYHAVLLTPHPGFQELRLPFSAFRQLWSSPISWDGSQVAGFALIVGGTEAGPFAYEVDEVVFYAD